MQALVQGIRLIVIIRFFVDWTYLYPAGEISYGPESERAMKHIAEMPAFNLPGGYPGKINRDCPDSSWNPLYMEDFGLTVS